MVYLLLLASNRMIDNKTGRDEEFRTFLFSKLVVIGNNLKRRALVGNLLSAQERERERERSRHHQLGYQIIHCIS